MISNFAVIPTIVILITYLLNKEKMMQRSFVPNDKRTWDIAWSQYKPISFTLDFTSKPWADPDINDENFKPKWNQLDGKIDRRSHQGPYLVVDNYPLNPLGRTGANLRGKLGHWGPNHAVDSIVTRWKRNINKEIIKDPTTNKRILEFVAIQRRDTNEWAIPGGMVDPGEKPESAVKREFFEEALNSLELHPGKKRELEDKLREFFSKGVEIYRGIVNDPRNTDNAWIETIAFNFHDENGDLMNEIEFNAGDDARNVNWVEINNQLKLYANHAEFIIKTAKRLEAHL